MGSAAVTEGRESTALGRRSYAGAQSATALGTWLMLVQLFQQL